MSGPGTVDYDRQEEFRKNAHKRHVEFWAGPGLGLAVLVVLACTIAGSFWVMVHSSDTDSKHQAGQFVLPIITGLVGVLGGQRMSKIAAAAGEQSGTGAR